MKFMKGYKAAIAGILLGLCCGTGVVWAKYQNPICQECQEMGLACSADGSGCCPQGDAEACGKASDPWLAAGDQG